MKVCKKGYRIYKIRFVIGGKVVFVFLYFWVVLEIVLYSLEMLGLNDFNVDV